MEVERNQLGWSSWRMTENAARDCIKWQKLLSSLMHQLGCEEDKNTLVRIVSQEAYFGTH